MSVESVDVTDAVVRVEARAMARRAARPGCGCWSSRIHGSYLRFPRDLPMSGKLVVVSLRVRRFVCAEGSCPRKTFTEQVPGLTCRFARRTARPRLAFVSVGLALAGRAGARMSDAIGVRVSRHPAEADHLAAGSAHRHSPRARRRRIRSAQGPDLRNGHRFAERTRAKHATVHALPAAGHSKRSIAQQLGYEVPPGGRPCSASRRSPAVPRR